MRLKDALRIQPDRSVLAGLIGAGGKTRAMAVLGRELRAGMQVVLTTTTRMGVGQEQLADRHSIVETQQDLLGALREIRSGQVHLLTGAMTGDGEKWLGLSQAQVTETWKAMAAPPTAILVEADGARQRSIKFPAQHEPALPAATGLVLLLAGLDALGESIDGRFVHRPEDLASYLSLPMGATLELAHLVRLFTDPAAGLRGVPESAEVHLLLNKADSEERIDQGLSIAHSVLAAGRIRSALMTELHAADPVKRVVQRIGAVILAAGASSRFPVPKQLVQWRGKPLILHAVEAAVSGGLDPVIVVLGSRADAIESSLPAMGIEVLINPNWEAGQSSSVRLGLEAIASRADGVVFLLADMPQVDAELVRAIVLEHQRTLKPLVAPFAGGRRANPVLFDRSTYSDLSNLQGDQGGRSLFDRYDAAWLEWDDRVLLDIDTPEDLARLQARS